MTLSLEKSRVSLQERHALFIAALHELMRLHGVEEIIVDHSYSMDLRSTIDIHYKWLPGYPEPTTSEGGLVELQHGLNATTGTTK